jgi:hypothetical protein
VRARASLDRAVRDARRVLKFVNATPAAPVDEVLTAIRLRLNPRVARKDADGAIGPAAISLLTTYGPGLGQRLIAEAGLDGAAEAVRRAATLVERLRPGRIAIPTASTTPDPRPDVNVGVEQLVPYASLDDPPLP